LLAELQSLGKRLVKRKFQNKKRGRKNRTARSSGLRVELGGVAAGKVKGKGGCRGIS